MSFSAPCRPLPSSLSTTAVKAFYSRAASLKGSQVSFFNSGALERTMFSVTCSSISARSSADFVIFACGLASSLVAQSSNLHLGDVDDDGVITVRDIALVIKGKRTVHCMGGIGKTRTAIATPPLPNITAAIQMAGLALKLTDTDREMELDMANQQYVTRKSVLNRRNLWMLDTSVPPR